MAALVPTRTAAIVLRYMVPSVATNQLSQVIAEFAFAELTWKHAFATYNTEAMIYHVVSSLLARNGPYQGIPKINLSRTSIMDHAVSREFTSVVRALHDSDCVHHCTAQAIGLAAQSGHLEIVQFFHDEHHTMDARALWSTQKVMTLAAFQGHVEIVAWLVEQQQQQGSNNNTQQSGDGVFVGAARNGHLHVIQRLHALNATGWSPRVMDAAAQSGNLEIIVFLHTSRTEGCTTEAMDGAALAGKMEIIQFLHENRHEGCTAAAMDNAASRGHLEIVQFLHEHRTEGSTTRAMDGAAAHGSLDVVRFLHENRTEGCTEEALASATENRNLEMVQFLVENRTEGCVREAIQQIRTHDYDYYHGFRREEDTLVLDYLDSKTCHAHCVVCGDPPLSDDNEE